MLRITDIRYAIAGRPLLDGASAVIPAGHKVGLVGRNGTGKTTLFKLIRGELPLDAGTIALPRGARIGGVDQEVPAGPESLLDTVLAADTERAALLAEAEVATDPARIAHVHERLAAISASSAEARAAVILKGLGFDEAAQARACAEFSGGWRMRVALAGILFAAPDILLLDEPTNYLDLEGALWLEGYLARYPHTVIIISHDRGLLNRAVGSILHVDQQKLTYYSGPYDQFVRQRAARREQDIAAAVKQEAARAHLQSFVDRFRYKASKAKQAQARLKMIERLGPAIEVEAEATAKFTFPVPEELSPPILTLEDASAGYDGKPVLRALNLQIDADDRIALLGMNGEGKSTLSKLLSGRLDALSGKITRHPKLRVGYFAQHQVDELDENESPIEHVRRHYPGATPGALRSRLAGFGITAEIADNPVEKLSGGQKARLSLLLAVREAPHLLILDEPTNHLDIQSREALVMALGDYRGAVILVSHDMHLLSLTADRLWKVGGGAVRPYSGDLESYRDALLTERGQGAAPISPKAATRESPAERRRRTAPLIAEVSKCEARITKLEEMRTDIDRQLADPGIYAPAARARHKKLATKRTEVEEGLRRAEALWIAAQARLDEAQGA